MKKSVFLLCFFIISCLFSSPISAAEQVTLYVRNKEFRGKTMLIKGALYAPLEPLLKAMKCSWNQSENLVELVWEVRKENTPLSGDNFNFVYREKQFQPPLLMKDGVLFVSVPEMARGINMAFQYNKDTGIADVFISLPLTVSETKKDAGASGSVESPLRMRVEVKTEKHDEGTPVIYYRSKAYIMNQSHGTVKEAVVTIHYQDQNCSNKELFSDVREIGNLAPGQEVTQEFFWAYSSLVQADIKVTLTETHK